MNVNLVQPGTVQTRRRANLFKKLAAESGVSQDEYTERFIVSARISRLGTPDDIAQVVGFLCTDAARWVHGAIIDVDGGQAKCV